MKGILIAVMILLIPGCGILSPKGLNYDKMRRQAFIQAYTESPEECKEALVLIMADSIVVNLGSYYKGLPDFDRKIDRDDSLYIISYWPNDGQESDRHGGCGGNVVIFITADSAKVRRVLY